MTALTDYLLAKHATSLTEMKYEPVCVECPGGTSIRSVVKRFGKFIARAYKAVCDYFERTAREHNQMTNASESWNGRGVYTRGLR